MNVDKGIFANAANDLIVRYWRVTEENCCRGLSFEDFVQKFVNTIMTPLITREQLESTCIEKIYSAQSSVNQGDDINSSHDAKAILAILLLGLIDVRDAMDSDASDEERLGRLLSAAEQIAKMEILHPINSTACALEERVKHHFAKSGVKARGGDYSDAKEILRKKLSDLHSTEGRLPSIQYALDHVVEAVVGEFNKIETIKKKLSMDRAEKTMRSWISDSDMLALFFQDRVIQKSKESKARALPD